MLFCAEWSSSKTWCYKFLLIFIQNMIYFVQSQSHCKNKPGSTDLHPKHVVLCRVIFIQNMLFCAELCSSKTCCFVQSDLHPKRVLCSEWSSSKTWFVVVFQSRRWCSYTAIPLTFEEFFCFVFWLCDWCNDWFGSCDSGDALLVAHFPLCLSLCVVFLGFFFRVFLGWGFCIFVTRIP